MSVSHISQSSTPLSSYKALFPEGDLWVFGYGLVLLYTNAMDICPSILAGLETLISSCLLYLLPFLLLSGLYKSALTSTAGVWYGSHHHISVCRKYTSSVFAGRCWYGAQISAFRAISRAMFVDFGRFVAVFTHAETWADLDLGEVGESISLTPHISLMRELLLYIWWY